MSGARADVLAARENYRSSELADRETFYRSLPEVSLSAFYSLHSLAQDSQGAWEEVRDRDLPTYQVSLDFTVPLDFWTLSKVRAGYQKDFESSRAQCRESELEAQKDWGDLAQNWMDVKSRLALAKEVKEIQEKRVIHEQQRFQRGRTTTFQLLTAENDLDDATLNVYRMVFEELVTAAQAQLYNTRYLP